jgi:hypothetical protein
VQSFFFFFFFIIIIIIIQQLMFDLVIISIMDLSQKTDATTLAIFQAHHEEINLTQIMRKMRSVKTPSFLNLQTSEFINFVL